MGLIDDENFGPVGLGGEEFEGDCSVAEASGIIHDVGNCYLWHAANYGAGYLDETFINGLFNPQHTYNFDSCDTDDPTTGNSLLVYFSEAAGVDMTPVIDWMFLPNAGAWVLRG